MTELSVTKAQAATRLLELIAIRLISESIYVAAALGLADLLADGPKSVEELAKTTGVRRLVSTACDARPRDLRRVRAGFRRSFCNGADGRIPQT